MGHIMDHNVIQTVKKTSQEYDEFIDWINEHFMDASWMGDYKYYIVGDEDAVLFKLRWGV